MRWLQQGHLCAAILLGTMSCSGVKGVIIDSTSLQTPVHKFRLVQNNNAFHIIEGAGVRKVPVDLVSWIKISPREARSRDGKTYFLTEIELKDGTKIMSYKLKDGRKSQAFLCVDDIIDAETDNGPMKLKLSKVAKITFE